MALTGKATPRQIAFLENRGVAPHSTKKVCSRWISFIKNGNGTVGKTEPERIALAISAQKKWNNKRVRQKMRACYRYGVVLYIKARTMFETMTAKSDAREYYGTGDRTCPFVAIIRWHDDSYSTVSVAGLEIISCEENIVETYRASSVDELLDIVGAGHPNPSDLGSIVVQIKLRDGRVVRGTCYEGGDQPDVSSGGFNFFAEVEPLRPFVEKLLSDRTSFVVETGGSRMLEWTIEGDSSLFRKNL